MAWSFCEWMIPKKPARDNPNQRALRELAGIASGGKPWTDMRYSGTCLLLQSEVADLSRQLILILDAAKDGNRQQMAFPIDMAIGHAEQSLRRLNELKGQMLKFATSGES